MKIAIIGMMGSGKTEIGRILASRLGFECVDLDAYIEADNGTTVADIFRASGEAEFRALEENALALLANRPAEMVICCGGGVVLSARNRQILRERCITVWLDVPPSELVRRLEGQRDARPLLLDDTWMETIRRLYSERRVLYEHASTLRYAWREGEAAQESASEIERLIRGQAAPSALQEGADSTPHSR